MKNKITYLLLFILFISTLQGLITSADELNGEGPKGSDSHTIFVEIATTQVCKPCHYYNEIVNDLYSSGDYDFQYVEMIIYGHDGHVLNDKANDWDNSYDISGYPTSILDGDYQRVVGNYSDSLIDAINACESRTVAHISASMTVLWLGSGIIRVDISIQNNEESQYDGHIRACITEIVSRYDTYYGDPYHFGFLDYAFDMDISILAGGTYTDSVTWNGNDHQDNHGDDFGDIDPDNIQVTMGILNADDGYADGTVKARIGENNPPNEPSNPNPADGSGDIIINSDLSWDCNDPDGDPLTYDVYFGTSSPPPLVASNHNGKSYDPGEMNHETTHYWQIVAKDNQGASTSGPIWSFNTKKKTPENIPPRIEILKPEKAFYLFNSKILPRFLRLTLIIGKVSIEVNASDEDSGIEKVEFYINNRLIYNDTTAPYTLDWTKERLRVFHFFILKAVAYDYEGATAQDWMIVKRYL